jgi:mono/diheme cytochrome c family protein
LRATLAGLLLIGTAQAGTVWDGVYSPAQAERGKAAYTAKCAACHKDDLTAYQGVLKGDRFMEHWREDNLNSLYSTIKTTMPRGAPASLDDAVYIDILAFVLQSNGFPAGSVELAAGALRGIQVEGKSGPEEAPVGALVGVVGCLEQGPAGWIVTSATKPLRTRNPYNSTPEELKTRQAAPLGKYKLGLRDADLYHPETLKGQKVEAKGFMIRNPGEDSINLTSLQTIDSKCGP